MWFWLIWLLLQFNFGHGTDWTWSYRKKFNGTELESLSNKAHITFAKFDIPKFHQLILSWNARRPETGYFTFYVQSRDSKNKKWSLWYKIAEWGEATQRTHFVRHSHDGPANHYVRFEQPPNRFADAFRLRVEAHGDANLGNVRELSVSVSDLTSFQIEPVAQLQHLESVELFGVPQWSQMSLDHVDNSRMCSPTAISMLLGYLCPSLKFDRLHFAQKVYDHGLDAYGSWPFNTAAAFEACPNRNFRVVRLSSFVYLYKYLKRGLPVVVSVRGFLDGAPKEYKYGHLITVVGWDQKNQTVICHDPAIEGDHNVKCAYKLAPFLRSWESSHRLAYVAG